MNQPFQKYQNFIREQTQPKPRKKPVPKAETANGLTKKIVLHIRAKGGFSTRLQSTGLYRADLKKYVGSQQVSGMPDIMAVVNGLAVLIEVKVGRDTLSEQQEKTIESLEKAGAYVFIARSFEEFTAWFSDFAQAPTV